MKQIHNKKLYNKLRVLTESALYFYNQYLKLDPQRMSEEYYVFLSLTAIDNEIKQISEFCECEKIMKSTKEISNLLGNLVGTNQRLTTTGNSESCLLSFLKKFYLKNVKFSLDMFNQKYTNFEELFYSKKLNYVDSTALYNFQCEETAINLHDGIAIKKMIVELPGPEYDFGRGYATFSKSPFVVQRMYETSKIIKSGAPSEPKEPLAIPGENELNTSSDIFDKVINSLRILKSSAVYRDHKINSEIKTFHPHSGAVTTSPFFENIVMGEKCILAKSEIGELSDIYQFIAQEDNLRFNIAMRRLNLGMERRNIEDKLIDYMIGFEALYLPDENNELTFRLSLRIAYLIGNKKNRKEIFNFVKKMYATRSKIVHGNKYELTDDDIKNLEELLRNSLKLWIQDKTNFSVNKYSRTRVLQAEGKLDNIYF